MIWTAKEPSLIKSLGLPLVLQEAPASSVRLLYMEGYDGQFEAK